MTWAMLADNLKSATFAATTMAAEMVLSMSAMALGSGGKKGGLLLKQIPYSMYYKPMGDLPYISSEQGVGL